MKCKRLNDNLFEAQNKCYMDIHERHCQSFQENANLFLNSIDYEDINDRALIELIKKSVSNCKPKIDLFSIIFKG